MLLSRVCLWSLLAAATGAHAALKKITLDLTIANVSPDGFTRKAYVVNGQTPGPRLDFDEGDSTEILVNNKLDVALTVHWHGVEMKGTPWSDGVPGITQRMINPGQSFTYKFTLEKPGTFWYHAHSRTLYDDGVRGTIYVKPKLTKFDTSIFKAINSNPLEVVKMATAHYVAQSITVNDWKHLTSEEDLAEWNRTHIEQLCLDSVLINGKGQVNCPGQDAFKPYLSPLVPEVTNKGCALPTNPVFQPFPEAKPNDVKSQVFYDCNPTKSPLSVITVAKELGYASVILTNVGGSLEIKFSIDSHKFWVYSVDGQFHTPQQVDVVSVAIGQRYQAIVKLDQAVQDYTIRAAANALPQFISGYAVFSYKKLFSRFGKRDVTTPPAAVNQKLGYGAELLNGAVELDSASLKPVPASLKPPQQSTTTLKFELTRLDAVDWALNKDPFSAFRELEEPLLFNPAGASRLDADIRPQYPVGSIVDIVLETLPPQPPHPIHIHFRKAYIIGQGPVPFSWPTVEAAIKEAPQFFNLDNPPLRDTFNTVPALQDKSFTVIRYVVDSPSVTFMHCHINAHTMSGMALALLEGVDQLPAIPAEYKSFNA